MTTVKIPQNTICEDEENYMLTGTNRHTLLLDADMALSQPPHSAEK